MKTTLKNLLGWGSVLALVVGFNSSAFAGPGPQYWQQQERLRAERAAQKQTAAPTEKTPAAAMTCTSCKTSLVTEYRPTNVSGKLAPGFTPVGSKHECAACGGAIKRVRGQVTDDMKSNCPICAQAKTEKAACCSI